MTTSRKGKLPQKNQKDKKKTKKQRQEIKGRNDLFNKGDTTIYYREKL